MPENTTGAPWLLPYPSPTGEAKLGATDIKELAERITALFKERLTTVAEHGASFTAASGELVKCTANITVTLPPVAANAIVEILANGHEVKLGAGAALIYGDFITGATPLTFVGYQHIRVISDGTNWYIVAGEPKREQAYSAAAEVANNAEVEPSATRPAFVCCTIRTKGGEASVWTLTVGGVQIMDVSGGGSPPATEEVFSFYVPAGQKWKVSYSGKNEKLKASTLLL